MRNFFASRVSKTAERVSFMKIGMATMRAPNKLIEHVRQFRADEAKGGRT